MRSPAARAALILFGLLAASRTARAESVGCTDARVADGIYTLPANAWSALTPPPATFVSSRPTAELTIAVVDGCVDWGGAGEPIADEPSTVRFSWQVEYTPAAASQFPKTASGRPPRSEWAIDFKLAGGSVAVTTPGGRRPLTRKTPVDGHDVDQRLRLLDHADPHVRSAAVRALVHRDEANPAVRDALRPLLGPPDRRTEATVVLLHARSGAFVAEAVELLAQGHRLASLFEMYLDRTVTDPNERERILLTLIEKGKFVLRFATHTNETERQHLIAILRGVVQTTTSREARVAALSGLVAIDSAETPGFALQTLVESGASCREKGFDEAIRLLPIWLDKPEIVALLGRAVRELECPAPLRELMPALGEAASRLPTPRPEIDELVLAALERTELRDLVLRHQQKCQQPIGLASRPDALRELRMQTLGWKFCGDIARPIDEAQQVAMTPAPAPVPSWRRPHSGITASGGVTGGWAQLGETGGTSPTFGFEFAPGLYAAPGLMMTIPLRIPLVDIGRSGGGGSSVIAPGDLSIGLDAGPLLPMGPVFFAPSVGGGYGVLPANDKRYYGPRTRAQLGVLVPLGHKAYLDIAIGAEWMWAQSSDWRGVELNSMPTLDLTIAGRALFGE